MARRIANISNEDPIGRVRFDNCVTWRLLCAGSEEAVLTGVGSTIEIYITSREVVVPGSGSGQAQNSCSSQGNFIPQRSEFTVRKWGWVTPPRRFRPYVLSNSVDLSGFQVIGGTVERLCVIDGKIQIQVPVPRRPCRCSSSF